MSGAQDEPTFGVGILRVDDAVVMRLDGELDLATVGHFHSAVKAVLARPASRIVLDLSTLEFLDPTGAAPIDDLLIALPGRVSVRNASPFIRRVLTLIGMDHLISPA